MVKAIRRFVVACAENDRARAVAERVLREWRAIAPEVAGGDFDQGSNDPDAIFAFGGDGFLLEVVRKLGDQKVPIVGWHTGTMGFLMNEVPEDDAALRQDLLALSMGHIEQVECIPLRMRYTGADGEPITRWVFNEAGIFIRDIGSQAARFAIAIDGESMGAFTGDGILLSTSQGTTGYAVNAGGPAIDPSIPAITIAPVNASRSSVFPSLRFPIVLPPTSDVEIVVLEHEKRPVQLSADGQLVELDLRAIGVTTGLSVEPHVSVALWYPRDPRAPRRRWVRRLRQKFVDGADGSGSKR
ncbi:MAG: NAD(+)/NADH kinase [bacterium]|nr:NAD(+)/NADH kinase [bacterium]